MESQAHALETGSALATPRISVLQNVSYAPCKQVYVATLIAVNVTEPTKHIVSTEESQSMHACTVKPV